MKKRLNIPVLVLLVLLATTALPVTARANSAEPPGLTVIVVNAPEDLELSLRFPGDATAEETVLKLERRAWETCYRFFYSQSRTTQKLAQGVLVARSSQGSFTCPLPDYAYSSYNNLTTLDLETQQLSPGQSSFRLPLLVGLRVSLTLLIEGAVFFLFGYRQKRSWTVFLLMNLITQGGLNALLTGPNMGSYWMIGYTLGECVVLFGELLPFTSLVQEHSRVRAAVYVVAANIASLLLGGLLLTHLPV